MAAARIVPGDVGDPGDPGIDNGNSFHFMKNMTRVIAAVAFFSLAMFLPARAATIDLPLYGFQIDALDSTPSTSTPTTVLEMFLPATESFAPNINVQIQPYTGTIKDYVALSKSQFEQMKWKVVSDTQTGDNEWNVEYTGAFQGNDLHFYARAMSTNGKVYVVTATAKESQWPAVSDTLRKHVDSFKTTPAAPTAPGTGGASGS